MSATAKIKLQFGTLSAPPGSPQAASIQVQVHDGSGTKVGQSNIACDASGKPASNEADFPLWAGTGFTASAVALDANNASVGSTITSAPFDLADNMMQTVVIGVTGGQ